MKLFFKGSFKHAAIGRPELRPISRNKVMSVSQRGSHGKVRSSVDQSASAVEESEPRSWRPVPGAYASPLSVSPLFEAKRFTFELGNYLAERQAAVGHKPVFKLHAGLRSIACTDHASGAFYFDAPRSVLEREPQQRFGPLALRQILTGGCNPALVASGEQHARSRGLTDAVLRHRGQEFLPTIERVAGETFAQWAQQGSVELFPALQQLTAQFAFRWLLDVEPVPADVLSWQANISSIVNDVPLASALGMVIRPRVSTNAKRGAARLAELARTSSLFEHYRKLAAEHGVPGEELGNFLVFLCCFNGSGALTHSLFPSLIQLSINRHAQDVLVAELEPGLPAPRELMSMPWLDGIHSECVRLYTRPRLFYKKAICDFGLPTNDGTRYAIWQGDLLVAVMPAIHRDPAVFESPDVFDPARFARDPSLKDKVFGYGRSLTSDNPYGCAAHVSGHAPMLWKSFVARLFRGYEWDVLQDPDFHINHFFEVSPIGLQLENFRKRGVVGTRVGTPSDLLGRFREATIAVRALKVSFDRKTYQKLYGLYKQALQGDNSVPRPGPLNVLERSKWDGWSACQGMRREDAMAVYIDLVAAKELKLKGAYRGRETPDTDIAVRESNVDLDVPCEVNSSGGADVAAMRRSYRVRATLTLYPPVVPLELAFSLEGDTGRSPLVRAPIIPPEAADEVSVRHRFSLAFETGCIGVPQLLRVSLTAEGDAGSCVVDVLQLKLPELDAEWTFARAESMPVPCVDESTLR